MTFGLSERGDRPTENGVTKGNYILNFLGMGERR